MVYYQSLGDLEGQEIGELKVEFGETEVEADNLAVGLELLEWECSRKYYFD